MKNSLSRIRTAARLCIGVSVLCFTASIFTQRPYSIVLFFCSFLALFTGWYCELFVSRMLRRGRRPFVKTDELAIEVPSGNLKLLDNWKGRNSLTVGVGRGTYRVLLRITSDGAYASVSSIVIRPDDFGSPTKTRSFSVSVDTGVIVIADTILFGQQWQGNEQVEMANLVNNMASDPYTSGYVVLPRHGQKIGIAVMAGGGDDIYDAILSEDALGRKSLAVNCGVRDGNASTTGVK